MQENFLSITRAIQIPHTEFEFTFARSGGPGGQNVNKVSSKAVLRWPVIASTSLPPMVRQRFLDKYGSRITTDGDLIVTSQQYRDQKANMEDCLEKLKAMITEIVAPPTFRRPTKPTLASKRRRSDMKQQASTKKQQRRRPSMDD